ncbi:MAG: TetR/AcrR family transcriptional regulator [Pseudomonadota bacterium]
MGLVSSQDHSFLGSTFDDYRANFPYQGDQLFRVLFERNQDRIKSKKIDIAANNLQKIFESTFTLSAKMGFHEMSLRGLSKDTGISMGGLYSCLSKKEDIALMVLDIVELVTTENNQLARAEANELISLEMGIKYHLYASTLLQPWFFFLYFETRSLNPENQQRSKNIEMNIIAMFEETIKRGLNKTQFDVHNPYFVAHIILLAIQDWYLKPWKNKQEDLSLETYSDYLFIMVKKLLRLDEGSLSIMQKNLS